MSSKSASMKALAQKISRELWGFVPNRNIKPVHFANGFFRELASTSGSPTLLRKAAGGFKKGNSKVTTDEFVEEARGRLKQPELEETKEKAEGLRAALDAVLAQDSALYGAGPYSVTLTHWKHTSSDPSDQKTGQVIAGFLYGSESQETIDTIREELYDAGDSIFKLTAPLLDKSGERASIGEPLRVSGELQEFLTDLGPSASPVKAIVDGIDRLTKHSQRLEKTAFLQRLVTFCGFALYYHVINSTDEAREGKQTPIFLCSPSPSIEIKDTSRSTYREAKLQVKKAFEEGVRLWTKRRGEEGGTEDDYREKVATLLGREGLGGEKVEKLVGEYEKEYKAEQQVVDTASEAFVRAIVPTCFDRIGTNDPITSLTYTGRHSGFIGPFRGPGEKYYRTTPQFIDALVCSLVSPDEGVVTEGEFWERAWSRYGIICGARSRRDLEKLHEAGIRKASANKLRQNAREVRKEFDRQGYAHTYADSATLIEAS